MSQVLRGQSAPVLLTDGQAFGESMLYRSNGKRTSTVLTHSYCQLMMLSKSTVDLVLQSYPDQYEKLMNRAKEIYDEARARRGRTDEPVDRPGTARSFLHCESIVHRSSEEETRTAGTKMFGSGIGRSKNRALWNNVLPKKQEEDSNANDAQDSCDPALSKIVDDIAELKASVNALLEMAQQRAAVEDLSETGV